MLAPPKQMSFVTISNENIFVKTQGTRLDAIVTPSKGPEQALTVHGTFSVQFYNPLFLTWQFLAFKDLYIQTNLHNKFLKKLYKTMNFDLHT